MTTKAVAVQSAAARAPSGSVPAAMGMLAWIFALIALPMTASLQARILLLAPLVVVPRLLEVLPTRSWSSHRLVPSGQAALLAALPLLASFAFPAGPLAAALALPWLGLAALVIAAATLHGLRQLPGLLHPRRASELASLVACGFLAVGAAFVMIDRLGIQPLGFSAGIVLLTAVHFHWAGFGLLAIAAGLAAGRPRLGAIALGLAFGIPLTAAGFTLGSTALSALGAFVTGTSGVGIGLGLILDRSAASGARRWGNAVAGVALLVAMPMAIAWSVALALGTSFLDIDVMVRTHGALNALAVTIVALTATRREQT